VTEGCVIRGEALCRKSLACRILVVRPVISFRPSSNSMLRAPVPFSAMVGNTLGVSVECRTFLPEHSPLGHILRTVPLNPRAFPLVIKAKI